MGTSPICERRFCRHGRNGRGGQREASRAKRGLRERIEQQRPITALHFTVLLFKAGNRLILLIGIVRRSRSGGSAAARGSRARLGAYKLVASAQAYPEVSDEVRRAAGSTHEQHSGNCSGELATLLLPDKDNHEIEADQITAPGAQQRRRALADCGRSVPSRASSSGGAAVSARRAQRTPAASADDVRIAPVRRRTTGSHQKDAIAAATDHQVRTAISGRELHDDETAFAELSHYGLP
jgi:hypothetical protein